MQESSLHATLKILLSKPGDQIEAPVDGFVIDIMHDDQLIEIQTGNFAALKYKLPTLLDKFPIFLVYPIPVEKWILRELDPEGTSAKKRKSPKHGRVEQLFNEIVRIPHLVMHQNFSLLVLMTKELEIWQNDGKGSWRRNGWSIKDRILLDIVQRYEFRSPKDYLSLLPGNLPARFTCLQIAGMLSIPHNLARRMVYSLRMMEIIERVGKRGRAFVYQIISDQLLEPSR